MKNRTFLTRLLPTILLLIVAALAVWGIAQTAATSRETELEQAYESIRRAVVTCYAIEGRYPQSYEYCKEHYGVRIDEEKYTVIYTVFASNLMPDVTILENE
ncbi:MAG: hypothetical protein IJC93_00380 [Clostridia bacterium]|nr:hypothetical protein [Clostridia bacterium]